MADLGPAKDIIRGLDRGIQLRTTEEVAKELERRQRVEAVQAIQDASLAVILATPGMTIEDANQLNAWQQQREERWGA